MLTNIYIPPLLFWEMFIYGMIINPFSHKIIFSRILSFADSLKGQRPSVSKGVFCGAAGCQKHVRWDEH